MSLLPSQIYNFFNSTYNYLSPPPSPQRQLSISREPSASAASSLKARLDAACQSPTSTLAHLSPTSMRRELDVTKHDLAKAHADTIRLEERCKMLERTLKETRELLRSREAELEKVRRERDRERAMGERRRSDVGPQYSAHHAQASNSNLSLAYPRNSSSLDTRMSSAELARHMHGNRMHLHQEEIRRTPSPSRTSSASASTSTSTSISLSSASTGISNGKNGKINGVSGNAEEERARLRSAETYMSRIDNWDGAQVLQAVLDINSEILQFAASATETCKFLSSPSPQTPKLAQAIQDTSARIGPNITSIISSREHSQDPLLVQLALQGCLSLCIARALNSFCIGFPSKSDAVLSQIYTHMHLTEPQPTSAKWRALTHQHIHSIYPTLTDYSVNELSDTILRWCADIFFIANGHSFSPSSPTIQSPSSSPPISISPPVSIVSQTTSAHLRVLYLDQIRRISRAVLRLASITREEIMSTSFEVTIADPSGTFDDREMVDAFGEYGESHGLILVTMELGLKCVTRVAPGLELPDLCDNTEGHGGNNGMLLNGKDGSMLESRVLLQPKVVLESVLEVIDR
ncbi:hypothetical protein JR316_0003582 [Psilocybe cubensis]|uniref:Uncharacterized protein n=2 Tax=Psilocybe cubensis TaxID=181762 RepID=A0A8H8CN83_PSICU|nr:hypothetical protein JR316_0003582 [Psilocybe cubensis]KAH9484102.1 hypothetical protein JR316_0003582 [Psilocybe cubensis]